MTAPAPLAVLILHNRPGAYREGAADSAASDAGVTDQVEAVEQALRSLRVSYRRCAVGELCELPGVLRTASENVVFNLVEALAEGSGAAAIVPDLCRAFDKHCTGSGTEALRLTLHKWRTKVILEASGIRTPPGLLVPVGDPIDLARLSSGMLIVKPVATDASEGISTGTGVVRGPGEELTAAVANIHRLFDQPALVESLIGTRELNVSVVEIGGTVCVLPLAEIDFSAFAEERPHVVDYAAKWDPESFEFSHTPRIIPAPIPAPLAEHVRETVLAAWRVTGCSGYARVDLRFTDAGELYVLEVNANPDISPDAGFAAALVAATIDYADFVAAMIGLNRSPSATHTLPSAGAAGPVDAVTIVNTVAEDIAPILAFLADTSFFRPDEVLIAREVLEDAVGKGAEVSGYHSWTAHADGRPVGWVCYGPTACTVHTFDIFWIGVDPAWQGHGIGRRLMDLAEKQIAPLGGRITVVETSGRELYDSTRAFYVRLGYQEAARLPDFYGPDDPKIILMKAL